MRCIKAYLSPDDPEYQYINKKETDGKTKKTAK